MYFDFLLSLSFYDVMLVRPCAFPRAPKRLHLRLWERWRVRACSPLPTFIDLHFLSCARVSCWGYGLICTCFKSWVRWITSNTPMRSYKSKGNSLSLLHFTSLSLPIILCIRANMCGSLFYIHSCVYYFSLCAFVYTLTSCEYICVYMSTPDTCMDHEYIPNQSYLIGVQF